MNASGTVRFFVKDTNGRAKRIYKAVVLPTSDTQRGATQRRRVS